jgi:hypothetical protein
MQSFMIHFLKIRLEVKGDKQHRNQHGKMLNTGSPFYRFHKHSGCHGRFTAQEAGIRREFRSFQDACTK